MAFSKRLPAPSLMSRKRSFCVEVLQFSIVLGTMLEKAMAPHSSTLAWKIPWMEEPGRLQSMGLHRVRHD